jgi:hypothetical protein
MRPARESSGATSAPREDAVRSDDGEEHLQRALRVRAEAAALVRATEEALDRSEAALIRLCRLRDIWKAIAYETR